MIDVHSGVEGVFKYLQDRQPDSIQILNGRPAKHSLVCSVPREEDKTFQKGGGGHQNILSVKNISVNANLVKVCRGKMKYYL